MNPRPRSSKVRETFADGPEAGEAAARRAADRDLFFALVTPLLPMMQRFVRFELTALQCTGDLEPGDPALDEVVDAALIRGYREFVQAPSASMVEPSWLIRLALIQIDEELRTARADDAPIEENAPESPGTEEASRIGEEIFDFLEPNEDLRLEDLVPDLAMPAPDREAERRDLLQRVWRCLVSLPREQQRVLRLVYVEGMAARDVARGLGMSETDLARLLDEGQQELRERLIQEGCVFREDVRR